MIMTDHPPPVVQRGSAVLIRGAALPLMYPRDPRPDRAPEP